MNLKTIQRFLIWNPTAIWKLVQQCLYILNRFRSRILFANLYFFVVLIGAHFAAIGPAQLISAHRGWQDILLSLISMPVTAYAASGLLLYYLHLVRFQESRLILLLKGYKYYLYILLFAYAYYVLYLFLIKFIIFSELESLKDKLSMQIRLIFGVLAYLFFLTRLLFAPAYITDHGLSTKSGFKYSLLLTSGRGWKTLVILLTFAIFMLFGSLPTLGIFAFWWVGMIPAESLVGLIFTLLLFGYSFGLAMIAYIRIYDLYQQSVPDLKNLKVPPPPEWIVPPRRRLRVSRENVGQAEETEQKPIKPGSGSKKRTKSSKPGKSE